MSSPRGAVAVAAFHRSAPIGDICDPAISQEPIFDVNWGLLSPDLREFLLHPQAGARGVARRIFAKVAALRLLQYKAP